MSNNVSKPSLPELSQQPGRMPVYTHLPRIELRQLRYFLAVAEELNFTRAAKRMGIAQPPLSQQIIALERQLRATLFTRSRRQVSLTPEGRALENYARRIINTTLAAAEMIQAIAKGEDGPLAIGAIFSSIYALIPHILPHFSQKFPGVRVHLQEMTISQQIAALRDETIDVGILRGPVTDPNLETLKLFEEPFVAVVPASSPLAQLHEVTLQQVASEPLIRVYPSANRDYSRLMFGALESKGLKLNVVHEVSDTHTLIGLVGAGFGVSLVPASLQHIQIKRVKYVSIIEETPKTEVTLAWKGSSVSPIRENFVSVVRKVVESSSPNLLYDIAQ